MANSDQAKDKVDALLKRARDNRTDLKAAEAALKEALALEDDHRVWFERGELYKAHAMLDKALSCYDQAHAMDADNGDYARTCQGTKSELELQRTKLAELELPKVIVAMEADDLQPGDELKTKIIGDDERIGDAPAGERSRFESGETVILDDEAPADEPAPEPQPVRERAAITGEQLVTKILWKGAEALERGAEVLGGLGENIGQPGDDDDDEETSARISRKALNEKLTNVFGGGEQDMLTTLKETPGEIKGRLSRMLSSMDQEMLETVQTSVKETAAEVKGDLLQMLKTMELGTRELDLLVEEEAAEEGAAEEGATEEGAAEDGAAEEGAAEEGAAEEGATEELEGEDGLAIRTRALLEVIYKGDADAVLDLCRGEPDQRPDVPGHELALVTVTALVTVARQILLSLPDVDSTAGQGLERLREELGVERK